MTVHTYPIDDLIEHDTDGGDCPCGPTTEAAFHDDGSNGWQVIHHSLDGREADESCDHDWMLRPESDTYECLICGEESL